MIKRISCSDVGKDGKWFTTAPTEEELMKKVTQYWIENTRELN